MRRRSTVSDGRPPALLAQPPSVRIQAFKDFAIAHPLLVEAKDRLLEAILESAPNSIVIVLGPTGVGKTTLMAKIRQLLRDTVALEAPAASERIAVVTMEATPPESRTFSWRSHFKRLLLEMNDPLVDCKRRPQSVDRAPQMMSAYPNDRGVTADYHYAVEQALRYRRPSAVLIDEAQHLFALASPHRTPQDKLPQSKRHQSQAKPTNHCRSNSAAWIRHILIYKAAASPQILPGTSESAITVGRASWRSGL